MEDGFVRQLKDGGINNQTLKVMKKEKVLDTATLSRFTDNDLNTLNQTYKLGQGQVINLRSVRNELVPEASPKVYVDRHVARFSRCVHMCMCVCVFMYVCICLYLYVCLSLCLYLLVWYILCSFSFLSCLSIFYAIEFIVLSYLKVKRQYRTPLYFCLLDFPCIFRVLSLLLSLLALYFSPLSLPPFLLL